MIESFRPQGGGSYYVASGKYYSARIDTFVYSPGRRRFVAALVRGNLSTDAVEMHVLAAGCRTLAEARKIDVVGVFSSAQDPKDADLDPGEIVDPGRNAFRWISDEEVTFLWDDESGVRQAFALNTVTGKSSQLSKSASSVSAYGRSRQGDVLYASKRNYSDERSHQMLEHGYIVENIDAYSLAKGWVDSAGMLSRYSEYDWFLAKSGSDPLRLDINGLGRDLEGNTGTLQGEFSPDGKWAVVVTTPGTVGSAWDYYTETFIKIRMKDFHENGLNSPDARGLKQLFLLNTETGQASPIMDAPFRGWRVRSIAWAEDSRSFVTGPTFPPPGEDGIRGREGKSLIEVDVPSFRRTYLPIPPDLKVDIWLPGYEDMQWVKTDKLEVRAAGHSFEFTKRLGAWQVRDSANRPRDAVEIFLRETCNDPPVICARDRNRVVPIRETNPQFRSYQEFAQVEPVRWQSRGLEWEGLLYHSVGTHQEGPQPLVIQTYTVARKDEFSLTGLGGDFPRLGPGWSIFIAQALALAGISVIQTSIPGGFAPQDEALTYIRGVEDLIESLDKRKIIDPTKVGLSGWSRTGWYVLSALALSDHVFASAIASDCIDGSYISGTLAELGYNQVMGSEPFGKGLKNWLEKAPGFQVERIYTPLRLQSESLTGPMIIGLWEIFERLRKLEHPVEFFVVPGAYKSSHTTQKPSRLKVIQERALNWHRFWLTGRESHVPDENNAYRSLAEKYAKILAQPRPGRIHWEARQDH